MIDSEVIRIQHDAIAKYCKDNRELALKIIEELGLEILGSAPVGRTKQISADDLNKVIRSPACCWPEA